MEGFSSTTGLRDNANRRWGAVRTHVLTLNAARRFRTAKRFRGATTVITAANKFVNGALQDRKRRTKEDPGLREDWQKARATQNRSRYGMSKEELNFLAQYHYLEGLRSVDGVAGLVSRLHSDAVDGIHPDEVEERMGVFDSNRYSKKRMKSFSRFFFEAFQDPTLVILTVCAVVSVVVGIIAKGKETGWYDGVAISFAIIAVVLVTSISDYKQACQFRGISEVKENVLVTVSRGGSREVISIWELVVGDVVHLRSGDQIPGDGVLMQGHNFLVDESSMTGESVYVKKDKNERPFLMSGCKVADGQGKMLVIAVGINTEWGRIMATLSGDTSEQTPLQVRLYGAATFIGTIGLAVAVLVLIVLLIRFGVNAHKIPKTAEKIKEVIDIIEVAVAIVVVSVPEGLPLAVTLTLAYSMRQMMTDKAFVGELTGTEKTALIRCRIQGGVEALNPVATQYNTSKSWSFRSSIIPIKPLYRAPANLRTTIGQIQKARRLGATRPK